MCHLALSLWLLALPAEVENPVKNSYEAVQDPCAVARQIASQRPCLRPEDCAAFQDWKHLFGVPRTEPLTPLFVAGGVTRASGQLRTGSEVWQVPMPLNCLVGASSEAVASNTSLKPMRSARGLALIR